ncbi:MAG TPA: class I SAM-dependent methyltransferase [Vicinamibacterales bacterium]|nr:class I SAM-dependent methyltransferase [Vicinamibacterales bacterium]
MKRPLFDPAWPEEVLALYNHDVREIWDRRVARHIWNQYHNQLDLYLTIAGTKRLRVLDIGCAQGTLALLLAERGHSVEAVDIRPQFIEYARSRYEYGDITWTCANAMEWQPSREYDLIFANQVLEHLVRPVEFTTRLARWLSPRGRLVVTTPNWLYVKNDLPTFTALGDPRAHLHREFSADADGHFFAYTAEELRSILRESGLTPAEVGFFETPWISGHMKLRLIHGFTPSSILSLLDRASLAIPYVGPRMAHQLLAIGINGV